MAEKKRKCGYCGTDKPLADFINGYFAQCLACWLREYPEKIEAFRRALDEVGGHSDE